MVLGKGDHGHLLRPTLRLTTLRTPVGKEAQDHVYTLAILNNVSRRTSRMLRYDVVTSPA